MLKQNREKTGYQEKLEMAVEKVENLGFDNIRADLPEFDTPAKLVNQNNNDVFIPDITAKSKSGKKAYFELSKKVKDTQKLVNKWKLLSTMATIKEGAFQIFVPHGSMKFTKDLVTKYNIAAELIKI
ncbi:hypothetical protein LVD15_19540 [Fulvivirga maritima]|uniref:hypothetical protein n=1 Tax=Fulvivirga maritima TaxID=2904247 RepID=UPI001F35BEB9|nr:hypothetical protein [Fulvivirga maritima]UII25479.1 hypothetical protein LVD15_19540 [Fulvivirga maritima]